MPKAITALAAQTGRARATGFFGKFSQQRVLDKIKSRRIKRGPKRPRSRRTGRQKLWRVNINRQARSTEHHGKDGIGQPRRGCRGGT